MSADGLISLVGETLQLKDQTVQTSTLAGRHVGLYFSAHWCPPCRGFTPKLVEWYKKFKDSSRADCMDMIFVSSDRDEDSFKEYYAEMPWHALPYSDRTRKASLSKMFKVSGIPTLLIIDAATGDVLCKSGRAKVDEDPTGENFPWNPRPLAEILKGPVLTKDGEKELSELIDGKVRGIYFSAHWCPPCRGFTPKLVQSYKKLQEDGKKFEIIFVSWDKDEDGFNEYFGEMPWVSFPREDKRAKELANHFEVEGIPTLVILDEKNTVITEAGRGAIDADAEGKDFPWWPKPLNELTSAAAGLINSAAALIYLTGDDEAKTAEAQEAMKDVAEKYFADRKANPKMKELNFFYESKKSEDLPDSLRAFASLGDDAPLLFYLDIGDQEKLCLKTDKITKADVEDAVAKFKASTLECKPLRG